MQRKAIGVITACVLVAVLAVVAVTVGPARLLSPSNPETNPATPGTGGDGDSEPRPLAVEKPTWQPGDSWTYSARPAGEGHPWAEVAMGTIIRTVESVDANIVNVSVVGSFRAHWTFAPDKQDVEIASMPDYPIGLRDATVGGYTWYRASDLATLREVRTITFRGAFETTSDVYAASYRATVETTFEPALNVWSFPLDAGEAWTATSTATVRASVQWSIETPTQPWVFGKEISFTREVNLALISGAAEEVVTPAGTFEAIPVWTADSDVAALMAPRDPGFADGLEEDVPVLREHTSAAWFSAAAKNVVRVAFGTGGSHLELSLTAYHVG